MRATSAVLGVLFATAPLSAAFAQAGNVAEINFQVPKVGMTKQYEAGRKKHMDWHKRQNDTWTWYTWQITSGEFTGTYITASLGHEWKDFDGREKFLASDLADLAVNVGPTLEKTTVHYYVRRDDISVNPGAGGGAPSAMLAVTTYLLRPDGVPEFLDGVKKVNEGIKKTNYPQAGASRWYQLANGGESPTFVLVSDRANYAALKANDKTLDAMMEEAYGKDQGPAILSTLRKTFRKVDTVLYQYRPDLSYVPAAK